MKRVYKYPLELTDTQSIELPVGAAILTVQAQNDAPQLWALVNPVTEATERRTIRIAGTGHNIDDNYEHHYIATFQMHGGQLVFHAFEIKE